MPTRRGSPTDALRALRARPFRVPAALWRLCVLCWQSLTELSHRGLTPDLSPRPSGSRAPPNQGGGPRANPSPVSPEGALGREGGGERQEVPGRPSPPGPFLLAGQAADPTSAVLATSLRPCWAQAVSSKLISLDTTGISHWGVPGIPLPCLNLLMSFPSTSRSQTSGQAQRRSHTRSYTPHTPLTSASPSGLSQHPYSRTGTALPLRGAVEEFMQKGRVQARPACRGVLQNSPPDVPLLSCSQPRRKAGEAVTK